MIKAMAHRTSKTSSNDHPTLLYMRGYEFWKDVQFWERDGYTERGKELHRAALQRMKEEHQKNEARHY